MNKVKEIDYSLVQRFRCVLGVSPILCDSISEGRCGCIKTSEKFNAIAKIMMEKIMYDNGVVDRFNPEEYPKEWVLKIAYAAFIFFTDNPDYFTDGDINTIAIGDEEDNEKYKGLWGYDSLNKILNDYHDHAD